MADRGISVVHFTNSVARGGVEEHILTLLGGLDRRQFRLQFVCTPDVAEQMRPDLPSDVTLYPLHFRKPSAALSALRLMRILRQCRADILHSHLFYSSLFASPVGRACGVPVILETPHLREEWRKGRFKSKFVVDRAVGRLVDRYIAVSEANAQYLSEVKRLPKKKITVVRNGADLSKFSPAKFNPAQLDTAGGVTDELKKALGFRETDPVLLAIARLEPQKGHRILLEALSGLRCEFPSVRLVCLGDGQLRLELERIVRDRGLSENVRFVGFQKNVCDWLALADISVLSSFYEGLPLAAIESLAAGKPVVATAVDGTPEVVIDRKTGLIVPAGDPARLAGAILDLLRDPERARTFGNSGRRWVLENFTQERQIAETQALYLRMIRERSAYGEPALNLPGIEDREKEPACK
ncbi:MAG TPA: glycosyltransferase family 4 protein [Bryobacteraceae bacterium]|nr:glycosyltransferase family 4 protein [Bryobacteraceae bacterium]